MEEKRIIFVSKRMVPTAEVEYSEYNKQTVLCEVARPFEWWSDYMHIGNCGNGNGLFMAKICMNKILTGKKQRDISLTICNNLYFT
jgi:hypothetical protein